MSLLIGLLGSAGQGKSTVAKYLEKNYGATRYAFADPLKDLVQRSFDFSNEQIFGTQVQKETVDPRWNLSPRQAMQKVGQAIRDVFGADIWVQHALARIAKDHPRLAVIEDVRYVNEARALTHQVGGDFCVGVGHVWLLDTPGRETTADETHPSESEWSSAPHDYVIRPAYRDLEHLYSLVREACAAFQIFPIVKELT